MSSSKQTTDFGISLDANSSAMSDYKCEETSLLPNDISDWLDRSLSQPNDPLSLLMRDLDFELASQDLPRCEADLTFDSKLMFNDGSSSSDSPLSTDSGNHSPKSLSSSEAVCDLWQVNPLNKIANDHSTSEYASFRSHELNVKGDESIVPNYESMDVTESYGIRSENAKQMSFANEVDETLPVLDSVPIQTTSVHESASAKLRPPTRLVPVQLPIQKVVASTSQASSATNQPVIYILPASSNSVPSEQQMQSPNVYTQNVVNNVQFLSSNNINHNNEYTSNKRSFPTTTNRSQPYPSIRPKLLIPKRETSSPPPSVPIIANPIQIQTVSVPTISNAVITPIATINGGLQLIECRTTSTNPTTTVTRNMSVESGFDEFSRKKEDRKIRNRASAQLSRIRKRNEIDAMKQTIVEKDALIAKLKEENQELKETISLLRTEGENLKRTKVSERARLAAGTVCVAVVIMMVTFSPPSLLRYNPVVPVSDSITEKFPLNSFEKRMENSIQQHGRTLLSIDYDAEQNGDLTEEGRALRPKKDEGEIVHMGSGTLNISNLSDCNETSRIYWNQTEAIRLNNDLSNWVDRHERVQFIQTRRIFRPPSRKHSPKNVSVSTNSTVDHRSKQKARITPQTRRSTNDKREEARLKAVRERAWRHIDMISTGAAADSESSQQKLRDRDIRSTLFTESYTNVVRKNAKRLRGKPTLDPLIASSVELKYMDLTRTLKQRDDTLYVIAMKDYLLLPATDRNITMHPKVAFILPALSYNGTLDNHVPMMRIECEITGTGLFHIADSLVSLFYTQSF